MISSELSSELGRVVERLSRVNCALKLKTMAAAVDLWSETRRSIDDRSSTSHLPNRLMVLKYGREVDDRSSTEVLSTKI